MKALIIAEKPSVARDIAAALGGFKKQTSPAGDFFERDDALISSGVGHLVQVGVAKENDPGYNLSRLPCIPDPFDLQAVDKTKSQLRLLKSLMVRKDVTSIVNACDAGREGELIFRLIYNINGCTKPMYRMWFQSMTPAAIRESFDKKRAGKDYDNLSDAAMCRSESDWLVGINGTRAMSIFEERRMGARAKVTVGRVQTPTLCILVDREAAIRTFKPRAYYEIHATFAAKAGTYAARWISTVAGSDPDAKPERIFDKVKADEILARCKGKAPASVTDTATELKYQPPKLFDLTTLQREANKKFGLSAKQTLDIAQALYEKHKALTYPRTDASALPEDYIPTAKATLDKLAHGSSPVAKFAGPAVAMVVPDKRIFNNAKISDHFAIIPTGAVPSGLSSAEQNVYDLVLRRFVAAFYPPAKYNQTERVTMVDGETFKSSGRVLLAEGWLTVYGKEADDEEGPALCAVAKGELPPCKDLKQVRLETKAPPRYTEATLLTAMETAGAAIDDDELREAMRERGLGTPATRAAIIEKLLDPDVGYLVRDKKHLVPTEKAFGLIARLRELALAQLTEAKTTGDWEYQLKQMETGKVKRADFMGKIKEFTRAIIAKVQAEAAVLPPSTGGGGGKFAASEHLCPKCGAALNHINGKFGWFFGCPDCKENYKDVGGKPVEKAAAPTSTITVAGVTSGSKCPKCKKGELQARTCGPHTKTPGRQFLSCSNFFAKGKAKCDHAVWPDK